MPWAIAAAVVGSSLLGSEASGNAADAQSQAARESSATQMAMFNQSREDSAPWRDAGYNALARLVPRTDEGGDYVRSFTMDDYKADPGYNFRLKEGIKAIEASAAARGLLQSGANLKGINRYAQDTASGEYTNAFNRFQLDQSNRFNRNAALAGIGQTAQQQLAAQGTQVAGQIGQNQLQAGNAAAAGIMGGANAFSNSMGQGMNFYNQNRMLDMFQNRGGMGGGVNIGSAGMGDVNYGYG